MESKFQSTENYLKATEFPSHEDYLKATESSSVEDYLKTTKFQSNENYLSETLDNLHLDYLKFRLNNFHSSEDKLDGQMKSPKIIVEEHEFRAHNHYFKNGEFYFPTGFGRSYTINMKDSNENLLRPNENVNAFRFKLFNKKSCELTFSNKNKFVSSNKNELASSSENELDAILYDEEDPKSIRLRVNKSVFVMKHTCSSHTGPNDEFEPYNKIIGVSFKNGYNMINQYINAVNELLK